MRSMKENSLPAVVTVTEEDPEKYRRIKAPEGICRVVVDVAGFEGRVKPGDAVRFNGGKASVFAVDSRSITIEW